ncbi:predicted ORF [Xanthomonas phage XacN1]|nr:predicted ORF [Xanthomonas phage XacN1]
MSDEQPNPLRKHCGQVKRETILSSLTVTTYKTYAVKDQEAYDYDWDHQRNRTIVTLREPMFKKDELVLLVKTFNAMNKVSNYDLYKMDGTHICGFGRDTDCIQRNVYMDKKWL